MPVPLVLYDNYQRSLREFAPLDPEGQVGLYTCGPTVYDYQHIGNYRTFLFEDLLKRALEWNGCRVRHVMNITDVGHLTSDMDEGEDKLELASQREGRSVWDIAQYYTDVFLEHLGQLRVRPPTRWAKATDHIAEMIDFARVLDEKGFAYRLDSGLYFDTSKVPDYGKLALLDLEGLQEGARVAPTPGKRNPTDFALWRASPPDVVRLMEWDSPWGKGAPGWHLECSTMSMKYLGDRFDIHTGGVDHIPVHHTNEIAQSEAYLGGPWVPTWLHNEFINLRDAKISKSKGGTLLLSDLEKQGFHPLTYRFFLLGSHYRNQIEFTWRGLESARIAHRRLIERLSERVRDGSGDTSSLDEAVSNDLNTAQALALLTELSREDAVARNVVAAFEDVLAIGLLDLEPEELEPPARELVLEADEVTRLLAEREDARRRRDFESADGIRDMLERLGVELRDGADGTTWRVRGGA
jgi:cysteinyl-tRNA synthetase